MVYGGHLMLFEAVLLIIQFCFQETECFPECQLPYIPDQRYSTNS